MGLESTNYISGLVVTNPAASDPKSQGDDHLRLLKDVLRKAFPGFTGSVMLGGTDAGAVNAYVLTPTTALPAYVINMLVIWLPLNSNTVGAPTLNISGLGAKTIKRSDGTSLFNGEVTAGQPCFLLYDGTDFRIVGVSKQYVDQLAFASALPAQSLGFLASNGTVAAFGRAFTGYAVDESRGADVPSQAIIDLTNTAVTGNYVHITGATLINTITLPAGAERTVEFDGALQLVHSANLILPGAATITTAAGDVMKVRGEGGGIARVVSYSRASGRAVVEQTAPGWVLLQSQSVAAGPSVNFLSAFSSTYDDYVAVLDGITLSVNGDITIRLANAGVVDSGNNYHNVIAASNAAQTAFSSVGTVTSGNGGVRAAGKGASGQIEIRNANDATRIKTIDVRMMAETTTPSPGFTATYVLTAYEGGAASGFQLLANFAATGTVRVYGVRKT